MKKNMNRYMIIYHNDRYREVNQFREAVGPLEAIEKLCDQYGWTIWDTKMTPTEIRGDEYAKTHMLTTYQYVTVEAIKMP